jgi:hypothetical protein
MSGETTFLCFLICLGLTIRLVAKGAMSNPNGTANLFKSFFK